MKTLGCLSLGSRFKRLSDRLYKDVASIYQEQQIDLHPTYFPLFNLLHLQGPLSVTQAAEMLNVTHPAISKIANKMQSEQLIYKSLDPKDERRTLLALDDKALLLLQKIEPILAQMRTSLDSIIDQQAHSILKSLDQFEAAYDEMGFVNPVLNALATSVNPQQVILKNWQNAFKEDFYRLNLAWLTKYFNAQLNDLDKQSLRNPESYYLARGGYIWFAQLEGNIVGCVALAYHGDGCYEISKMAVDEQFQGFGIGRKMLLAALDKALSLQAKTLYLETSSLRPKAITRDQHMGFKQINHPNGSSNYQRSDIYMELPL